MAAKQAYRIVNGIVRRIEKTRDSSGHEHDNSNGQFTSGGGGSSGSDSSDSKKPPKRSILSRVGDAAKKAGSILNSGVKVPAKALSAAKKLGSKAMGAIEKRYGSKVKKAVSIAVLISLPLPVPGMSVVLSAPILAFAELHKQFSGDKADDAPAEPKPELVKGLARNVLRAIFGGKIPDEIDQDALNNIDAAEEEKSAAVLILKDFAGKPDFRIKDNSGISPIKDATRMHMRFLVSTPSVDRDWEIVVPAGRVGDSYEKANGPWFFNHQQFPYAIGSSKERPNDPNCPLDLAVSDEGIVQGIFFNQSTKEAEILYRLYDDGDMSATSIGFQGLSFSRIEGDEQVKLGSPYPIRRWDSWEHVETSLVGVGANREALTVHCQRGTVGKLTIPDSLKMAFAPFVLPQKAWSNGAKFPAALEQSSKTAPTDAGAKAMIVKADDSDKPADDDKPADKPDESNEQKAGYVATKLLNDGTKAMLKALHDDHLPGMDDDSGGVKKSLMKACRSIKEAVLSHHETASAAYPDTEEPDIKDMDFGKPEDGTDPDADRDAKDVTESDMDDEEEKAISALVVTLKGQIETQEKLLAACAE